MIGESARAEACEYHSSAADGLHCSEQYMTPSACPPQVMQTFLSGCLGRDIVILAKGSFQRAVSSAAGFPRRGFLEIVAPGLIAKAGCKWVVLIVQERLIGYRERVPNTLHLCISCLVGHSHSERTEMILFCIGAVWARRPVLAKPPSGEASGESESSECRVSTQISFFFWTFYRSLQRG